MAQRSVRKSAAGMLLARTSAIALCCLIGQGAAVYGQLPEKFENLQVLPKDIEQRALIDAMRGFSSGLGVRCQHCHIGEEGQPLSSFDFASDKKETKRVARQMMRMTQELNETFLPGTGRPSDSLLQVSCVTCHRSRNRPESLEDHLSRELNENGTVAAVEVYRKLRERYYGRQAFDFGDRSLVRLAERLAAAENAPAALTFLELNLELYPESMQTLVTLGELHSSEGRHQAAFDIYQKALELQPGNPRLEQRLQAIEEKLGADPG